MNTPETQIEKDLIQLAIDSYITFVKLHPFECTAKYNHSNGLHHLLSKARDVAYDNYRTAMNRLTEEQSNAVLNHFKDIKFTYSEYINNLFTSLDYQKP